MEKTHASDAYAGDGSRRARAELEDTITAAREKVDEYGRAIARFVRERPAAALIIALGAGYWVGRLVRR